MLVWQIEDGNQGANIIYKNNCKRIFENMIRRLDACQ